jgi:hypothetical protein
MTDPVTLIDMERFAVNEATRIEVTQAALVKIGDITRPHPDALRNKDICEGIIRLIHSIRADPIIMDRLKTKRGAQ